MRTKLSALYTRQQKVVQFPNTAPEKWPVHKITVIIIQLLKK